MGKRLMVVDDSRVIEMQMQKLLAGTDYEIVAYCRDGEEAIDRYGEVDPDLVTMDIIMPGIDGLETAEADNIGVKAFVYKPLEREMLLEAFEKAMQP